MEENRGGLATGIVGRADLGRGNDPYSPGGRVGTNLGSGRGP